MNSAQGEREAKSALNMGIAAAVSVLLCMAPIGLVLGPWAILRALPLLKSLPAASPEILVARNARTLGVLATAASVVLLPIWAWIGLGLLLAGADWN